MTVSFEFSQPGVSVTQTATAGDVVTYSCAGGVSLTVESAGEWVSVPPSGFTHSGEPARYRLRCDSSGSGWFSVAEAG